MSVERKEWCLRLERTERLSPQSSTPRAQRTEGQEAGCNVAVRVFLIQGVCILFHNELNPPTPSKQRGGSSSTSFWKTWCFFCQLNRPSSLRARALEDDFPKIFWVKINKDLTMNTVDPFGETFLQNFKFLAKGMGRGSQGMEGPKEGKGETVLGKGPPHSCFQTIAPICFGLPCACLHIHTYTNVSM